MAVCLTNVVQAYLTYNDLMLQAMIRYCDIIHIVFTYLFIIAITISADALIKLMYNNTDLIESQSNHLHY